jgi:hypothetical protein
MRNTSLTGIVFVLLLVTSIAVSAQEVTQAEKDRALQYLESTKANLLKATKGLPEAQWNCKPAPDRWSVAQVMEHIAASEDFIRDGLLKVPTEHRLRTHSSLATVSVRQTSR